MNERPSPDEMKDLWRNQKTEAPPISLRQLQHKARKLQEKTRREIYKLWAMGIGLAAAFLYALVSAQGAAQRVGLGILIVWAILVPLRAYRLLRPGAVPVDDAVTTSIAFYRRQLERHSDYNRRIWLWFVAPMLIGIGFYLSPALAAIVAESKLAPKALPFFLLLGIWFVVFLYLRHRKSRKLRRKLDVLDELEKEIQS